MTEYRVYRLNAANRILNGQWVEAADDAAALALADRQCEAGAAGVEVWEGARLVGRVPCVSGDDTRR